MHFQTENIHPLTCKVSEKEPILIHIIVKFQSASDKEDSKNLGGGRVGRGVLQEKSKCEIFES